MELHDERARLKARRDAAMRAAEHSAFAYFMACQGAERTQAALVHEGVYCATQAADLSGVCAPAFAPHGTRR